MSFKINWKKLGFVGVLIVVLLVIMVISGANKDKYYQVEKPTDNLKIAKDSEVIDESVIIEGDVAENTQENEGVFEPKKAIVYVCGAVNSPMVIELTEEDRLNDAVELCGGLKEGANREGVNLAMRISDGAQYIIPSKGEELIINYDGQMASQNSQVNDNGGLSGVMVDGKININKATQDELQELTGIGEVLSKRIVDYRTENKGFKSIEELKQVEGIGDKKYENIKNEVVI